MPVGEEPDGPSWTGFQSVKDRTGYFIFFRENNPQPAGVIETWLPEGVKVKCTPMLGYGAATFTQTAGRKGTLNIEIPRVNSYVVYKYEIIK